MFLTHLQLADFRSYPQVDVALEHGVTTFVGANGQGKTNLVEAVEYLSTLSSHRVASEAPLIRHGAETAIIRARVQAGRDDDRVITLQLELRPGRSNAAAINRSPVKRPRDLVGVLRTVVFSPDDLAIVKGDPAVRRGFLDAVVVNRWPRLAGVKADYDRVLRQRNTLLKSLAGRRGSPGAEAEATLAVWDDHLADHGSELIRCRLVTLADLAPHMALAYEQIAPTNNVAAARYRSSVAVSDDADLPTERAELKQAILDRIAERRREELARGVSLVGPHRDDVALQLGELPARGYASHGESWSYALALRLGSFELLRADEIQPVLILDDVFAELDATRRERLSGKIADAEQVLITAAVAVDVPAVLDGARFDVAGGQVTR